MPAANAHLLQAKPPMPVALPSALHEISERIEESRTWVRTGPDTDEEGGYDEATWRCAAHLVGDVATSYWQTQRRVPPTPLITDGPDGVVDVLWKHGDRQLLLTVHQEPEDVGTFYGRNLVTGGDVVKGELAFDRDNEWLLAWLMA
jgi:hypothetical protein